MDDGRETFFQSYIFLILICHSIEDYPLNIHQSIQHTISRILQSFKEEILYPYPKKKNDISSESRYRFNV